LWKIIPCLSEILLDIVEKNTYGYRKFYYFLGKEILSIVFGKFRNDNGNLGRKYGYGFRARIRGP
jgi:hypothetical protein